MICEENITVHFLLVGSHTGSLTVYELRHGKCTTMKAHSTPVTALAFSPDGKFLVSYACGENKLSFWQTSTGYFIFIYYHITRYIMCKPDVLTSGLSFGIIANYIIIIINFGEDYF